jgi:hypothetical protein
MAPPPVAPVAAESLLMLLPSVPALAPLVLAEESVCWLPQAVRKVAPRARAARAREKEGFCIKMKTVKGNGLPRYTFD